jgi:hypothetical protein
MSWGDDAVSYNEAVEAAVTVLEAFRPSDAPSRRSGVGVEMAENFIRVLGADPKGVLNGFTRDLPELRNSLGALGLRLTGPKAPKNPFTLAMAILATSDGLNGISRKYGPGPLPAQPVVEVIERHLKPFLVADWQRRRDDAGHNHASGEDELAAEIRRRA